MHQQKIEFIKHFMSVLQEFPGGITNGNDWFPILGGMQDWNYIAADCLEITLELSEEKNPPPSTLPQQWRDNLQPLLDYAVESTLGGVCGHVRSAESAEPIVATISFNGIDKRISSKASFGQFCRPLAPGMYDMRVTAEGYQGEEVKVTVPREIGEGAKVNVTLKKVPQTTDEGSINPDSENWLQSMLSRVG